MGHREDAPTQDLLNGTYNDWVLNQMRQEARNDPFIWHAHILPLHKRLRQQVGLKDTPPHKPVLTRRILYYHTDHLGTPRELTDTNGNIVWAATYKAWGATQHIDHPPILQTVQQGNTVQEQWIEQNRYERPTQNLRFQGQYYDQETGLHYNRFRYYDPACGRFVSQDPVGLYGGFNVYQYASNPAGWIDPLGLKRTGSLGGGYNYRLDEFPYKNGTSFEVHVYRGTREFGAHGPTDWLNKHGGVPTANLPASVENRLNSVLVSENRKHGFLPPKGQADIKNGKWKEIVKQSFCCK